mgnify:CR=1 FL=1
MKIKDEHKIALYGGILFSVFYFVSTLTLLILEASSMIILIPLTPAITGLLFVVLNLMSFRHAKISTPWKFILRTVLSGLGIFACLFLINIAMAVLLRESEVFLVISITLPTSLFVIFKLQRRSWLYAGMSQSIGSFIVVLVLFLFFRGGAEMEAIFVASYIIIGFFFGVIVGLVKASVIFIIEKLSFKVLIVVLSLSLFAIPAFASGTYEKPTSGPWKGKIIDIETKESIEGAVVLAVWERVYRTPAGPNSYFYNAKEVLTDKEGRYEIPSYRPINLLPIISFMRGPRFFIFKPGYLSIEVFLDENVINKTVELPEKGKVFRLAPGIIELPRLKTREERRMAKPAPIGDEKDWKKQRQFIKLIRQEWEYIYGEPAGDLYKIEEDK